MQDETAYAVNSVKPYISSVSVSRSYSLEGYMYAILNTIHRLIPSTRGYTSAPVVDGYNCTLYRSFVILSIRDYYLKMQGLSKTISSQ